MRSALIALILLSISYCFATVIPIGGTTAQNNGYLGQKNELSVDSTLRRLRIHDGQIRGGYDLLSMYSPGDYEGIRVGTATIAITASYLNTSGLYYQGGNVGVGTTSPQTTLDVNGSITIVAGSRLYLDGGEGTSNRSYFFESSPDSIDIYCGGTRMMNWYTANSITAFYELAPSLGNAVDLGDATYYWRTIHYHTLTAHSLKDVPETEAINTIKNINIEDKTTYGRAYVAKTKLSDSEGENINDILSMLIKTNQNLIKRIEILENKK